MANRSYDYLVTYCYKEDGNRPDNVEETRTVRSTTVPRAISKLVRELNDGLEKDHADYLKSSDLLVIDVRCPKLDDVVRSQ